MKTELVHWSAQIGWGLGALDCLVAVLLLLFMALLSGLNRFIVSMLWLILPVGVIGLILSLLAFFQITEKYSQDRKRVKSGIILSLIGTLVGGFWFLVAGAVLRF